MPSATHTANSRMTSSASSSPSCAAWVTCSPRTLSASPPARSTARRNRPHSAACRPSQPRPLPEANRSQQPRRPHGHRGPARSTTMCPASPPKPWAPRTSSPSAMRPAPMPVPRVTSTASSAPRAAPATYSPQAAQVASLSIRPGGSSRRSSSTPTSTLCWPGRLGLTRSTPLRSTSPAIPTPTAVMARPEVVPSCRTTCAMASSRPDSVSGVGSRASAITVRGSSAASATPSTLVPPTSIPASRPGRDATSGYLVAEQSADAPHDVEVRVADADLDGARLRERLLGGLLHQVVDRHHLVAAALAAPPEGGEPIAAGAAPAGRREALRHHQGGDAMLGEGVDHLAQARHSPPFGGRRGPQPLDHLGFPPAFDLGLDRLGRLEHLGVTGGGRHGDPPREPAAEGRGQVGLEVTGELLGCTDHQVLERVLRPDLERDVGGVAQVMLRLLLECAGVVAAPVALAAGVGVAGNRLEQLGPFDQLTQLEHEHPRPLPVGQEHADGFVLPQHRLELA